jgi:membrane-bound inhibitor of C-type lysozyme
MEWMAEHMIRCLPACVALALAGCAAAPADPLLERTYLCDGGRLAVVTFDEDIARVRLANQDFELRRVPQGSGVRYTNERATLRTREDEALLMVDGRELGPCQEVKPTK